jgi:LacI family transcriptional regulator
VDGILLVGSTQQLRDQDILELCRRSVPVVLVERRLTRGRLPTVALDNRQGGRMAMKHLLACGAKAPGVIAGPRDNAVSRERLAGAEEACRAAGIDLREDRIMTGDWRPDSGAACARELAARGCDAVFAANDMMGVGAVAALQEQGRRVPEDVCVMGYDDIPLARFCRPALTSVRQPAERMGRAAALLALHVLGRLESPPSLPSIAPELVCRESTTRSTA